MENTQDIKINGSNLIRYNNNVIGNQDTDIILKKFKEQGNETENVAVFVLKYNLEQNGEKIPYEVVLGKIELKKNIENLSAKAKVVRDYLAAQLKENGKKQNNYEYCRTLLDICKKNDIPFIYTEEGIEIITNDSKKQRAIEKTYKTQEQGNSIELICLNQYKKMDLYESELNIRKKIDEKIKEHKLINAAMQELKTNSEREKLKIGININDLKNETNKEVILGEQRKNIINFLVSEYRTNKGEKKKHEEKSVSFEDYLKMTQYLKSQNSIKKVPHSLVIGQEKEQTNAEKYFRLKEKGIVIDIKKMLEDSQNESLEKEMENAGNIENEQELSDRDNYINNCKTICDFIKQGRDVNTQFFYSKRIDGFEQLYSIVEEQKDKRDKDGNKIYNAEEILEYLRMKEQVLKTIKLDKKKSFLDYELYTEHDIVKSFMMFVMNSEVRKDTSEQEKEMLLEMYQAMVNEIIKNAKDKVELYNMYAVRFNTGICPIPDELEESKEKQNVNEVPDENEEPGGRG